MSLVDQTLKEFQLLTRRYALFHAFFLSTFVLELLTLLIFMPFQAKTMPFAALVALTCLTVFTYFVLRFYFQTRKPQQFIVLRNRFLLAVFGKGRSTWSVEELHPIYELLQKLQGQESQYYSLPSLFQMIVPLVEKFSIWCHWEDVQWMKETLHLHALQKLFDWIKLHPTDVELHRTVAASYMTLYQIYQMPAAPTAFDSFTQRQYASPEMQEKFEKAAHSALEELKVVLSYTSNDPWTLRHMAQVYHDLELKQDEKKTYEKLLSLSPQDGETHYQLGKLYFELGHMAEGLRLYQALREQKNPRAQELITHYDARF
jgi:tetratricopeptide (TPR) repeat protein